MRKENQSIILLLLIPIFAVSPLCGVSFTAYPGQNQKMIEEDEGKWIQSTDTNMVMIVGYEEMEYGKIMFHVRVKNNSQSPIKFGPSEIFVFTGRKPFKVFGRKEMFRILDDKKRWMDRENAKKTEEEKRLADGKQYVSTQTTDAYGRTSTVNTVAYDPAKKAWQLAEVERRSEQRAIDIELEIDAAKRDVDEKILKDKTIEPGEEYDGIIYVQSPFILPKTLQIDVYAGADVHHFNVEVRNR